MRNKFKMAESYLIGLWYTQQLLHCSLNTSEFTFFFCIHSLIPSFDISQPNVVYKAFC